MCKYYKCFILFVEQRFIISLALTHSNYCFRTDLQCATLNVHPQMAVTLKQSTVAVKSAKVIKHLHLLVLGSQFWKSTGCIYKGKPYLSNTEWIDPSNPCKVMRCEAGIVTVSDIHCHTPCSNPLPPEPGKCCRTCPGKNN